MIRWFLAAGCLVGIGLAVPGSAPSASPLPGYAGYDWQVVAISHDGKTTGLPSRGGVDLEFSRDGEFGANDGINFYSGPYQVTSGGFTIDAENTTATGAGYAGHDPVTLLGIGAIETICSGTPVTARLTGDRLVVTTGTYTLTAQRAGAPYGLLPG